MSQHTLALLLLLLGSPAVRSDDSSPAKSVQEPTLRLELLARDKADQTARLALVEWLKVHAGAGLIIEPDKLSAELRAEYDKRHAAVKMSDQENTRRLGEIVEKHGWPTISLVGKDGSHAAWLLVQHADANTKFQRQCLDRMAQLPRAEISPKDLAYLTDRVLLAEGKPQIYGTQFAFNNGKWEPRPLEDAPHVDQRRAAAGLQPLAEYVKELESVYGSPAKK